MKDSDITLRLFLVLDPIDKFIRERSKSIPPGQEGNVRTGHHIK